MDGADAGVVGFLLCVCFELDVLALAAEWFSSATCPVAIASKPPDAPPSSLCDPKGVQIVGFAEMVRNLVLLPASSTKRGKGSCWKLRD